ncbi:MAG: hypothetical protein ACHQTE_02450 [Candidatus Saccharimonadales bacterium]
MKSVTAVSPAAAQRGHDYATQPTKKKVDQSMRHHASSPAVISINVNPTVWKTAMTLARTVAQNIAPSQRDTTAATRLARSLLVVGKDCSVTVYNSPALARQARR